MHVVHATRRYRPHPATAPDLLAREEPLEIRVARDGPGGRVTTGVAVTMRTPGDDADLALGFLVGEGLLRRRADVAEVVACPPRPPATTGNVIRVELAPGVSFDPARLERHGYASSACGLCGKTSLDAVAATIHAPLGPGPRLDPSLVPELPDRLRAAQPGFAATGGLHAAGLFDAHGALLHAAEDVGRHNAVDKVVGALFRAGALPLADTALVVSGRASFELVQKALLAGIAALVAVGAPSSLAVELAGAHGLTLLGFARGGGFNAYTGLHRLAPGDRP